MPANLADEFLETNPARILASESCLQLSANFGELFSADKLAPITNAVWLPQMCALSSHWPTVRASRAARREKFAAELAERTNCAELRGGAANRAQS